MIMHGRGGIKEKGEETAVPTDQFEKEYRTPYYSDFGWLGLQMDKGMP